MGARSWELGALGRGRGVRGRGREGWRLGPGDLLPWRKVKQNNSPALPAGERVGLGITTPRTLRGTPGLPGRPGTEGTSEAALYVVLSAKLACGWEGTFWVGGGEGSPGEVGSFYLQL